MPHEPIAVNVSKQPKPKINIFFRVVPQNEDIGSIPERGKAETNYSMSVNAVL